MTAVTAYLLLLLELITVENGGLPVTGLLLEIKCEAWRTSDLLKALKIARCQFVTLSLKDSHRRRALDHISAVLFSGF